MARPDRVRLTEFAFDAGKVRVKGTTPANDLLADYIARLDESPVLAGVTLAGSSMRVDRGSESWDFSLEASAAARAAASAARRDPGRAPRGARRPRTRPA